MKRKKLSPQKLFILIGLLLVAISAVLIVSMKIADKAMENKIEEQVTTADPYLDGGMDETPEPVPELPGLYESLLADGLKPTEAAEEYCKHIWIQYWCESKVLRTKQFTEYTIGYAVDDSRVYLTTWSGGDVMYHEYDWIDRNSFEYLGYSFFKDKNGFYYYDNYEGMSEYPIRVITNVDVATVSLIGKGGTYLVVDKNHVYKPNPSALNESKYVSLELLKDADPNTLRLSDKEGETLEDKNNYYTVKSSYFTITPKK